MLSAVGESAQVALQAGTIAGRESKSEKSTEASGMKEKRDKVTISAEAVQLTHAALNATEKSHDSRQDHSRDDGKEQAAGKK